MASFIKLRIISLLQKFKRWYYYINNSYIPRPYQNQNTSTNAAPKSSTCNESYVPLPSSPEVLFSACYNNIRPEP
ncbi:hypothetical protein SNE40_013362 [Patella caerulea]|uniref:Uncharacterized protein n=1 Tax=Patella caerulea TaxID=87958 RepID=A0AAN8JM43_PATCE